MANMESLHATIRRQVLTRGIQTHAPSLERISAEFCLSYHRMLKKYILPGVVRPRDADGEGGNVGTEPSLKTRAPGEWKAYMGTMAERDAKGRFVANSGHAYRALTAIEQRQVRELSISAKQAIDRGDITRGQGAFGPTRKQLDREKRRRDDQVAA
eukprot:2436020-Pyramimonas_sp.AAC.1